MRRLEVRPVEIRLRAMKRKWANCSTKGRVTFDTELLRQPASFRAEVIVHELLHLKVPNHGQLFRSLLRTHLAPVPQPLTSRRPIFVAGLKGALKFPGPVRVHVMVLNTSSTTGNLLISGFDDARLKVRYDVR